MKLFFLFSCVLFWYSCSHISQENYHTGSLIESNIPISNSWEKDSIKDKTETPKDPSDIEDFVFMDGLKTPWSMVFIDENTFLVTQRSGNIILVQDGKIVNKNYFSPNSYEYWEWWLMGITLDPDFESNQYIYIMYSYLDEKNQIKNKVSRITHNWDYAQDEVKVLDNIPWAIYHNWGRIKFGPDNKLYVTTWDARVPNNSQDFWNLAGKILRINADGSIPLDNPISGSRIYSYWHRNPQWIAFEPNTWELFASSHWPTGEFGLYRKDRILDHIIAGWNYGWPNTTGYSDTYQDPIVYSYEAGVPPAGMEFWEWYIWIATLGSQKLLAYKIELDWGSWKIKDEKEFFVWKYGRLRDVVVWKDGHLYILTSNRDGRWEAKFGDDKIIQVKWAQKK